MLNYHSYIEKMQPSGSGKSTVPLKCLVIPGGVSIILENTLTLASDQT